MTATAASPDGTRRFRERQAGRLPAAHFRPGPGDLTVASLGLGTYLGNPDDETDAAYGAALVAALELGTNLVDTAPNYRAQRSERVIGLALAGMIEAGEIRRDEVILCTKGGYLPFDRSYPTDPGRWIYETYVKPGLLAPADIVGGGHSLAPRYLLHQIDRSRANLRVETIDVYYLHNPESQLASVERREVMARMGRAFSALERAVDERKIGCYGLATWDAFRVAPESREYLALGDVVALAEREIGPGHHFRTVQLPCNLAMTEAVTARHQPIGDHFGSLVEAADHHGITVVASASLLQGKLAGPLPEVLARAMEGCTTDPQRAIQFARSSPGITTALVGMRRREHVEENLALARLPPASQDAYLRLFTEE
ncbi:MAG: auxin-induced protein [Deltaproteobacteria bacterium]|nr:auxin-induced protein [Deltaproteobacteria bacterium]